MSQKSNRPDKPDTPAMLTGWILAIDTSSQNLGLALWQTESGEHHIFSEYLPRRQSGVLHHTIQRLIETAGLSWEDMSLLSVPAGPGSFTGIRFGMAAAAGIAQARRIPLVCPTTLETLACYRKKNAPIACWVSAYSGKIYGQIFDKNGYPLRPPVFEEAPLFIKRVARRVEDGICICGDGTLEYDDLIPEGCPRTQDGLFLNPLHLAKKGRVSFQEGRVQPLENLKPFYLGALNYRKVSA